MSLQIERILVAPPTGTGTQDYTFSGFGTPKAALFILSRGTGDHAAICMGATTGSSSRYASCRVQDNVTSSVTRRVGDDDGVVCELIESGADAVEASASFDSWITDGVRLNWVVAAPVGTYSLTIILFTGTDLTAFVGNVVGSNVLNGVVDVTGVGFEADVLVTFSHRAGLSGIVSNIAQQSYGFCWNDGGADPPPQYSSNWLSVNNAALLELPSLYLLNDGVVGMFAAEASSTPGTGQVHDFDADGFSVETLNTTAEGRPVFSYLALNFGGQAQVFLGEHVPPTSAGVANETQPGFRPALGLMLPNHADAFGTHQVVGNAAGVFGIAALVHDSASSKIVWDEDAAGSTNAGTEVDELLVLTQDDGTASFSADIDPTPDGWDIDYSAVSGGTLAWPFLAIQLVQTATGAGSFPLATGTGAGALVFAATGTASFPLATGAATGALIFSATGAGSFPLATGTGSGVQVFAGVGAGTFPLATGAGVGALVFAATGAGSFPLATATGSGALVFAGSSAGTFPLPIGTGAGALVFSAAGVGTFPLPLGTGNGAVMSDGIGAGVFPLPIGTGAGALVFAATGAGVFPLPTATGFDVPPILLGCDVELVGSKNTRTDLLGSSTVVVDLDASSDMIVDLGGSHC